MTTYIIRRCLMGILIILLVTLITFFVVRLLPGDPITIYIGQQSQNGSFTQQQIDAMRQQYGLNDPIFIQYIHWLGGLFKGNLGTSINYHEQVSTLMAERFPRTIDLGVTAFVIANVLGILFGVIAAVRRGTWIDSVVTALANIGITIPVFWLGLILETIFGLKLGWLPIAPVWVYPWQDFLGNIKLLIMPVTCLAVTGLAGTARQTRSSMLEVVRQDYIRTAWSKGLRERAVILRHALKLSLIPVVTLMGMGIAGIFGGAVLVETVFAIPGIGRLMTTAIFAQDYQVIQSSTLVMAALIVVANLVVDISYGWFDPRVRYS
jgi:peptide/nickel transport system permease protein